MKVCPQGFSCCTVEMEEKLSQQSHTEIKAPVSRLSTNLQSIFKQRHDSFDSKHTHSTFKHNTTRSSFRVSPQQWMHVLHDLSLKITFAVALPVEEIVSLLAYLSLKHLSNNDVKPDSVDFSKEIYLCIVAIILLILAIG